MKITTRLSATTSVALLALALPATAAIERGTVEGGVSYAMGGVGLGERNELQAQREGYNLWVTTAARSGVYLANADVRITDQATGRVVLQGTINGPWLFADLPPGRYSVQATPPGSDKVLSRTVRVRKGGLSQAVLHFDIDEPAADRSAVAPR